MKIYLQKILCNYFIHELLSDRKQIFEEIGTNIKEFSIEFVIYALPGNQAEIINIAYNTFEKKYSGLYYVLNLKYFISYSVHFVNKGFTQTEIQNFTYHYFIPVRTNNRYVFKYVAANKYLKEMILTNSLWFSAPQSFTDITDCKFRIDTEASKKNILDFYYKTYLKETAKNEFKLEIEEFQKSFKFPSSDKFNADLLEHHYQGIISTFGISCFSETFDNTLMWDQYANGFRGVCLIFDISLSNENFYIFQGNKVRYLKSHPKCFFDGTGLMEMAHIIYSKSIEYKFEREIREFISFQSTDVFERAVKFNPQALKGIIFGPNCTDLNKRIINKLITDKKYNVESIQSRLDKYLKVKINKSIINLDEKL